METEMEMEWNGMEWKWKCTRSAVVARGTSDLEVAVPFKSAIILYKARQRRVIGSHQRPLPLRLGCT